jgi:putative thioredoxin
VATNVPPISASTLRGAVDLSGLVNPRPARTASGAAGASATDATFNETLDLSKTVPVIVEVYGQGGGASAEPVEEPLPPHHQEAFDAISAGDYATAIKEYKTALAQNPRDALATAGLAQVSLLQRLDGTTADEIRSAAASGSLESQLALADLELSLGDPAASFDVLLTLFPSLDAAGKTAARTRLLDYFEILGADDPLVGAARRRLTGLLY